MVKEMGAQHQRVGRTDRPFSRRDGTIIHIPLSSELSRPDFIFDAETRGALMDRGEVIVELTGRSIADVRVLAARLGIQSTMGDPGYEASRSFPAQVAINPDRLFIPGSSNKARDDHLAMVAEDSAALIREVPGARRIMGTAADFNELIIKWYLETGILLFGEDYGHHYTRTANNTMIGGFTRENGIRIGYSSPDAGYDYLFVSTLTVPNNGSV